MRRSERIVLVMAGMLVIAGVGAAVAVNGTRTDGIPRLSSAVVETRDKLAELTPRAEDRSARRLDGPYYVVDLPSSGQNGCPGSLGFCCEDVYVLVDDVENACDSQPGPPWFILVTADGSSNCCDCDHSACIEIVQMHETTQSVEPEACILRVDGCYVTCSGCLGDLSSQ